MNHVIIGTAGHVDHGKSTLIKALTGNDPDRLKEEKQRKITIELGFTWLTDAKREQKIGIIDVPGHEKFIRHMLKGVGGMDLVMLIIDSKESIMPQTKEHMDILRYLQISHGIVVFTKAENLDSEWKQLLLEDLNALTKGSFLQFAPIHFVSALNGTGIEELKEELFNMAKTIAKDKSDYFPRLHIDRAFTMKGSGSVVTGTLYQGSISLQDRLFLYPKQHEMKVRNIQVHGQDVSQAFAGQRVALNVTGLKKEEIERGFIAASMDSLIPTNRALVSLEILRNKRIKHGSLLRFHFGTSDVTAKIFFFPTTDKDKPLAMLQFTEKQCLSFQDRFVLRSLSPAETVAGGMVLHPLPRFKKIKEYLEIMPLLQKDLTVKNILLWYASEYADCYLAPLFYQALLNISKTDFNHYIEELKKEGKLIVTDHHVFLTEELQKLEQKAYDFLQNFHTAHPLKPGVDRAVLAQALALPADEKLQEFILHKLCSMKRINKEQVFFLSDFHVRMTDEQLKWEKELNEWMDRELVFSKHSAVETLGEKTLALLEKKINDYELIKISAKHFITKEKYKQILSALQTFLQNEQAFTLAQFRDAMQTTRKPALEILEFMDGKKISIKKDDTRVVHEKKLMEELQQLEMAKTP